MNKRSEKKTVLAEVKKDEKPVTPKEYTDILLRVAKLREQVAGNSVLVDEGQVLEQAFEQRKVDAGQAEVDFVQTAQEVAREFDEQL